MGLRDSGARPCVCSQRERTLQSHPQLLHPEPSQHQNHTCLDERMRLNLHNFPFVVVQALATYSRTTPVDRGHVCYIGNSTRSYYLWSSNFKSVNLDVIITAGLPRASYPGDAVTTGGGWSRKWALSQWVKRCSPFKFKSFPHSLSSVIGEIQSLRTPAPPYPRQWMATSELCSLFEF